MGVPTADVKNSSYNNSLVTTPQYTVHEYDEIEAMQKADVWAVVFCFFIGPAAETFFGVADITGAYFVGVILCNIAKTKSILNKKITVVTYVVFSPVFYIYLCVKTPIKILYFITTNG